MKEFLLIFRRANQNAEPNPSPEQLQAMMKPWQDWMGSIAAQNRLVNAGNRLEDDGRVLRPNHVITNGPFAELKESIGGYIIIKAESLDQAVELSKGCPILLANGSVEIRALIAMD
jgi:hypothetical protein